MVTSRTDVRRLAHLFQLLASDQQVTVGVHADEGQQQYQGANVGASVSEIAAWQEFGTQHIPARSWLRGWVDDREDAIGDQMRRAALFALSTGVPLRTAAGRFALWAEADIRQRIRAGIPPALDARTIKRKGSSVPLIDTGVFSNSVHARVE